MDSAEPIKNGVGQASLIKAPIAPGDFLPNNRNSFFRYEGQFLISFLKKDISPEYIIAKEIKLGNDHCILYTVQCIFSGSLTTPTCDEAVMWTILTESVPFAMLQIERFKETTDDLGAQLTNNFRQLQRLNSRPLVYVKQSVGDGGSSITTVSFSLLVFMQIIRKFL